jgi:hypothetical protein
MLDLSIDRAIYWVLFDSETLLPEDDISIVGIVILFGCVKITQHKHKGYVLLRNHLGRRV